MSTIKIAEKIEKKAGIVRGRKQVRTMSSGIPNSTILKKIIIKKPFSFNTFNRPLMALSIRLYRFKVK